MSSLFPFVVVALPPSRPLLPSLTLPSLLLFFSFTSSTFSTSFVQASHTRGGLAKLLLPSHFTLILYTRFPSSSSGVLSIACTENPLEGDSNPLLLQPQDFGELQQLARTSSWTSQALRFHI